MRAPFSRFLLAFSVAGILVFSLAGIASAHVVSKTILTTTGLCETDPITQEPVLVDGGGACGAAVYDSLLGFTGTITFNLGEGTVHLADFICENQKSTTGAFTSVGGSYTLTLSSGGTTVAAGTYTIAAGSLCNDGHTQGTLVGGYPVELIVPDGSGTYTVDYSLLLAGFDSANFTGDNSILNRIEEFEDAQANSPSVAPPQGTPPVPEAPLTILLLGTGGLTAVWYVSRKLRQSVSLTAA